MNKKMVRVVALVLASLMILSAVISGLSLLVGAAGSPTIVSAVVCKEGTDDPFTGTLSDGKAYALRIVYTQIYDNSDTILSKTGKFQGLDSSKISIGQSDQFYTHGTRTSSIFTVSKIDEEKKIATITLSIRYVVYNKDGLKDITVVMNDVGRNDAQGIKGYTQNLQISGDDITVGSSNLSSGGTTDDDPTYTPKIVVENAIALDSVGNRIDEVTKDTPSFTLEVVYADMGLQKVDASDIKEADMQTYITSAGGFYLGSSAKGRVVVASTSGDYPRFRATFSNVTFSGSGNTIEFQVYYILDDVEDPVSGSATATVYAARAREESSEEDKIGMAVPNMIISSYTYGQNTIEAGSEFNLDFTVSNTSKDIPLENIVITLAPSKDLAVASSSNTIYVPAMDKSGSQSFSVALRANANAEVGSHSVDVKFSYEYIDEVRKERKIISDKMESIAIPVTQLDRFTVEPITDSPYGQVGQEAYITVYFTNKGKAVTSNISGTVECDESISAPSQQFGNLEPGKTDSLDFYFTGSQPGQFNGNIIIQYEDESGNVKEIKRPIVIMIEEPWVPPMEPEVPINPEDLAPKGPGMLTIILCVIGGIAIAVPIALYLMKRVKAKGSEDFDEDF